MSAKPSILLVETDAHEAELVLVVFGENDLGEQLRVARTVDDAIALLETPGSPFTPHLILIGIADHGDRELELARRLRAEWRTRTIPLVVISSTRLDGHPEWTGLGVSSFVVRPFDFEQLVEAAGNLSLWWRTRARTASPTRS